MAALMQSELVILIAICIAAALYLFSLFRKL